MHGIVHGTMASLSERLNKVAPTDLPILIRGETGVGKELVAREIHRLSPRAAGPFVAINVTAIPRGLLEAELFGHVKGAFTGAVRSKMGRFRQSDRGTIFLDEIGDLPLEMQAKLLRVLQEKMVEPLGSECTYPLDFRVVSATHQNLEDYVATSRFRADLLFRIDGATLFVPPLRERLDEIEPLADFFVARSAPGRRLGATGLERLRGHSWPGNVRELEQVVARSLALSDSPVLESCDIALSSGPPLAAQRAAPAPAEHQPLQVAQRAFTLSYTFSALMAHGGDKVATARALGISERSLYRMLALAREEGVLVKGDS